MSWMFITGGARRIGRAIALDLAGRGYDLLIHYSHSEEEAKTLREEVTALGRECLLFQANFEEDLTPLLDNVFTPEREITAVINNASLYQKDTLKDGVLEEWNRHLSINLTAPYLIMQRYAKTSSSGQIINILDAQIASQKTQHFSYLLSKKALADLTQMAAIELGPKIRVNAVAPGWIIAPENLERSEIEISDYLQNLPLRRTGTTQEVCHAIRFLLENAYVTGEILSISGGV